MLWLFLCFPKTRKYIKHFIILTLGLILSYITISIYLYVNIDTYYEIIENNKTKLEFLMKIENKTGFDLKITSSQLVDNENKIINLYLKDIICNKEIIYKSFEFDTNKFFNGYVSIFLRKFIFIIPLVFYID